MLRGSRVLGAVVPGLVVAEPASAQERAVGLALRGGGFNSQFDVTWSAGVSYRLPFGSRSAHASR